MLASQLHNAEGFEHVFICSCFDLHLTPMITLQVALSVVSKLIDLPLYHTLLVFPVTLNAVVAEGSVAQQW